MNPDANPRAHASSHQGTSLRELSHHPPNSRTCMLRSSVTEYISELVDFLA